MAEEDGARIVPLAGESAGWRRVALLCAIGCFGFALVLAAALLVGDLGDEPGVVAGAVFGVLLWGAAGLIAAASWARLRARDRAAWIVAANRDGIATPAGTMPYDAIRRIELRATALRARRMRSRKATLSGAVLRALGGGRIRDLRVESANGAVRTIVIGPYADDDEIAAFHAVLRTFAAARGIPCELVRTRTPRDGGRRG